MGDNGFTNDTILNMARNFRSETNMLTTTPLKRTISVTDSLDSTDGASPFKRSKLDTSKLSMSYVDSPRESRRLRADLIEARNTIVALEGRIKSGYSVRKQMQMDFEEGSSQLSKQLESERKKTGDLEALVQTGRKERKELMEKLNDLQSKYNEHKLKSDDRQCDLERSLSEIQAENKHNDIQESMEVSSMKRKIKELVIAKEIAEDEADAQKKIIVDLEKRLAIQIDVAKELELKEQALQKARLRIKEIEFDKDSYAEYQEQAKSQAHKIARYADLEREVEHLKNENHRLKDQVRNKLLLEEEVHDFKTRLAKAKENEHKLAELQVHHRQNEMCLNEWRAVARSICESTDADYLLPHLLRSEVEKLQQQELNLTTEKVELDSQLKTVMHEAKVARSELEKNQKLVGSLQTTCEQRQSLIHRMQKKLQLISRERDSYRQQLDSYEKELTLCNTTSTGITTPNQVRDRMEQERIRDGYRDLIAKLEADLAAAQPAAHGDYSANAKAEAAAKMEDEMRALRAENERLRERRDKLEVQLENYLEGRDTLDGGKLMHLKNNPLSECLATREHMIQNLERECERLRKKLKKMEQGLEASQAEGDLTICPQEMAALREQVKSYEAKMQKLKDYFKSSMQEFRDVIYILLGYKVDRSNSVYKLRSMYAEHEEDMLCFQVKEGDVNLLENEYSETLEDMISLHLRHQKSYPVFLSALTMDLFNSRTKTFATQS